MIPSRALTIGEIFAQTFSIFGRTFTRYVLLFLICVVPGVLLTTHGGIEFTKEVVSQAEHRLGFRDQDLLQMRNRFRDRLALENPAFRSQLEDVKEADSSLQRSSTDSLATPSIRNFDLPGFIADNLQNMSGSLSLLGFGVILLILGLLAIATSLTDLACQVFEERRLDLGQTVRNTFGSFLWKLFLLYLIYIILSVLQNVLLSGLLDLSEGAGSVLSLLLMSIEFYLLIRLSLTIPALVSEELGPFAALRRSWQLTSGNRTATWLRVFGMFVLLSIFLFGCWCVLATVSLIVFGGESVSWWTDFLRAPTVTIAGFLAGFASFVRAMMWMLTIPSFLLLPIMQIFMTVLYYDLRTRKDGPLDYSEDYYADRSGGESGTSATPVMWQP